MISLLLQVHGTINYAHNFDIIEESARKINTKKFDRVTICASSAMQPHSQEKTPRCSSRKRVETKSSRYLISFVFPVHHPLESHEIGGAVFFRRGLSGCRALLAGETFTGVHDTAVTSLLAADWQLSALYSHDFLKTSYINHVRIPYNLFAVKRQVCVRKCTCTGIRVRGHFHATLKTIHPLIYYDAHHFLITYV